MLKCGIVLKLFCVGCVFAFCTGFKLEKGAIELTTTEAKKAPDPSEEEKVKEVPATPNFKTESSDRFMSQGPIQKSSKEKPTKSKPKKTRKKDQ
jgi:hypothetical protein